MRKNKTKRFTNREKELVDMNLELARKFLLEIINDPKKVDNIPSGATIVLYPVKVQEKTRKVCLEKSGRIHR